MVDRLTVAGIVGRHCLPKPGERRTCPGGLSDDIRDILEQETRELRAERDDLRAKLEAAERDRDHYTKAFESAIESKLEERRLYNEQRERAEKAAARVRELREELARVSVRRATGRKAYEDIVETP